jgi:diguanylate cyclase (GGDEF)-like protein
VQLSTAAVIERGRQPDAGLETSAARRGREDFLASIAAARQEAQALFELAQSLGNSLRLSDTLSMLDSRLKRIVPYDAVVVYVASGSTLKPQYVAGEDARLFASLEIPVGEGLAGWVAENRRPMLNGNPSVEPGYLRDPKKFSKLNSSLAVPLEEAGGVVGVLSLYRVERDGFSRDELRIVQAISSKLAVALANALRYEQAESSATTDFLTSLPNARSLFLHLDAEIARCGRAGHRLAVLVCDLDGFKRVNDRFGHLAGNDVLVAVAGGLKDACRAYDYVGRMGGDEFVVVMPELSPEAAVARAEEFDVIARQAGIKVCGEDALGLSAGVCFFPDDGTAAEDLLAEADRRMYRHKSERRSRQELLNLAAPSAAGRSVSAEVH